MSVRLPGIGSKAIALVATLFVLLTTSVVMDRLGAPAALTRTLVIIFSAVSIGMAGALTRTVRGSTYFSAASRLGSVRGTSTALVAATGVTLLAPAGTASGPGLAAAIALGLIGYAIALATPLNRSGVASLGAFAMGRFRSRLLALCTGLAVCALACILALAAGEKAAAVLKPATGLSEPVLRFGIAALALLIVLPGGYASLAAASVIVVMLVLAGVATSFAGVAIQQADVLANVVQVLLRESLGVGMTLEILAIAMAFAGMLAMLGTAAACRHAGIARQSGAAAMLLFLGLTFATGALAQIGGTAAPGLPVPFVVLLELAPGLLLIALLAALARCGATALAQDALGALGSNRSAMSSRLALNRIAAIAIILVASSGALPLPEPHSAWIRAMLTGAATLPLALLLPAFFRNADWRAAGVSVLASLLLTGLVAREAVAFEIWQIAAIFLGTVALATLVFRSRQPEDASAADVLTGRASGPLLLLRDA